MLAAVMLLAAALQRDPSQVEVERDTFEVAAHDFRYVPVRIAHWPATVICKMSVASGAPVAIELVSAADLARYVCGRTHHFVIALDSRHSARFRQPVPDKGEYAILLTNGGPEPSAVRLDASLEFAREPDVAKYLSPAKRLTVIAVSLAAFLLLASWSAWRLLASIRKA